MNPSRSVETAPANLAAATGLAAATNAVVETPLAAEVLQSPPGDRSPLSPARLLELRRSEHRTVLWISLAMLVAAIVLQLDDDGVVYVPLVHLRLPGVCWFRNSLGIDCPGCGLTRSVVSWMHLRPVAAWHFNPAGTMIATLAMFSVPYRAMQLRRSSQGKPALWHPPLLWLGLLVGIVLVAQWVYKLEFGEI